MPSKYETVPRGEREEEEEDNDDHRSNDVSSPLTLTTAPLTDSERSSQQSSVPIKQDIPPTTAAEEEHRNDENIMSVDEAIELLGMGRFQWIVLTAAGLCFAADAMQVLLLSFLCEVLRVEWGLSKDESASITSVLFFGAMVGTLILGPLADKKGRKPVFLVAATMISFFGMAVGFAASYWQLLIFIFLVGTGVGGLTVPFDILAEFLPADARGKNLLMIEYFWTVGVLLVVVLAYFTLGGGAGGNWRLFVILCSLPCWTSVLLGYFCVPESPRWMCTVGRCDEALDIVRKAAEVNNVDVDSLFPEGLRFEEEAEEESNFCELFSPRWRWTTIFLWGAWGAFSFGYYGTIMAITVIFDNEGSSDGEPGSYSFDYGAIFVSSSAELIGTTFAIFSVDVAGRIPLQVLSYTLAGISVFSLCILASNDARRDILIVFGFIARIFEMSGSCVSWVSTAEILTTEVRTTGHSAANAIARIGAFFSPFVIEGNTSLLEMGVIMFVVHAMTVFCVAHLPETKGSHMGGGHHTHDELHDLALHEEASNDEGFSGQNAIAEEVENESDGSVHQII
jgi:MFS family permease